MELTLRSVYISNGKRGSEDFEESPISISTHLPDTWYLNSSAQIGQYPNTCAPGMSYTLDTSRRESRNSDASRRKKRWLFV